jgi:Fe-S cluster assembly ATP-binding protein
MALLEIKNLHAEVDGKKILNGIDLVLEKGQMHAIMGPNGSGKSTLSYVLAGKPGYAATQGQVLLDGQDLLAMEPDERAAKAVSSPSSIRWKSRRGLDDLPAHRAQCPAQARGEAELSTRNSSRRCAKSRPSSRSSRRCCAAPSMSAFPAARRSATRFCR